MNERSGNVPYAELRKMGFSVGALPHLKKNAEGEEPCKVYR
jgi:hypothetical protein